MSLPTLHGLHRPLGSTGFQVSPLGLGTVKLGRDQGVKYQRVHHPQRRRSPHAAGPGPRTGHQPDRYRPAYGRSEERLGPLLRGQRDAW